MNDRWKHVKEIFSAAVATPPHKRRRLLLENCDGDEALLREVEELLWAHEGAGDFLEHEIASVHALSLPDVPDDPVPGDDFSGTKLGVYRLERLIGEGGMGTVYLARRDDELFEKRVAVKIIRRYHDDRRLERFRQEREILARLAHPNIAQLLDGGVTDDGLPYLVMEYVNGVPIDTYCEENDLSVRERLSLFTRVFSAVQYAHQSLVVHRDLKPSNILVNVEGEPKLLDFGIAKLLEDEGSTSPGTTTMTVSRWMTPEYASPEQVRGEPITTASDVYSLGVILYRLLTGQSPYDLGQRPIYEIERIISEEEPSKPSTVVTDVSEAKSNGTRTVRLRRRLKGDLDNIVLMALRKEAGRRYASVEQFGEDIDRFMNGLPVRAQRDTLGYRVRKFVQRNQIAVAGVAMFVVFAISAFSFIVIQSAEARRQRDISAELLRYTVSLFEFADPDLATRQTVSAVDLLDAGVTSAAEQLRDRPEQHARVLNLIGTLYHKLGVYDRAEGVYRDALTLLPPEVEGAKVADGYFGLGRSMHSQGVFDQAEAFLLDALELRKQYNGANSGEVAEVFHALGTLAIDEGKLERADSLIDQAIRIHTQVFGAASEQVANDLRAKASGLRRRGNLEQSAQSLRHALEIQRTEIGSDHPDFAQTLNSLGIVEQDMGNIDLAEELMIQALEIQRSRLGEQHSVVATTLNNLSIVKIDQGDLEAALAFQFQALEIETTLFGPINVEVARTKHNLAVLLKRMERPEEAAKFYTDAASVLELTLPNNHVDVAVANHDYAILLRELHDYTSAQAHYRKAISIYRHNVPGYMSELSSALNGLGKTYMSLENHTNAVSAFKECLDIRQEILPENHWRLGTAHSLLGEAMSLAGEEETKTGYHLEVGFGILRAALGASHSRTLAAEERLNTYLSSQLAVEVHSRE